MRIPSRAQRIIAIPLIVVAGALLLVRFDIILANRHLDVVFIFLVIYIACELLFWKVGKQ